MNPSASTQNLLSLIGRALLALLFIPAGFGKIAGFAGTAGYIASKGLPLPEVLTAFGPGGLSLDGSRNRGRS